MTKPIEPEQASNGCPVRKDESKEKDINVLRLMQRGLIYPAPFARFCLLWTCATSRNEIRDVFREVRDEIHANYGKSNTTAVFGVSFGVFKSWVEAGDVTKPEGMEYKFPCDDTSEVFKRSHGVFQDSGADVWVHIKSDKQSYLQGVYQVIQKMFQPSKEEFQDCESRNTEGSHEGKVLGCRFSENLNNPADPLTITHHTLIGSEDIEHAGGSFVLAQRFVINWEQLHNMSEEQIEDIIGRTTDDIIIPSRDTRTHLRSARFRDEHGDTKFVMRLGLPFGQSSYNTDELKYKGSGLRDEEGIFFAGFSRNVQFLEGIMDQQIGKTPGFMNDRLLSNVRSTVGGFFYVPSKKDLGLQGERLPQAPDINWRRFPGVNWDRLSRHFTDKSKNGCMYYNHKNYLFEMATMGRKKAALFNPPSNRILTLLLDAFTRWQDTWYFPKGQPEMKDLHYYIKTMESPEKADEVMNSSIAIRKGWATRMTCRLYASEEYGFRGKREIEGEMQEGADTFRIHPLELIVGAMPDLTLAQGRYVIPYLREEEKVPSFFRGLSEASGVGHVVPDFQKLVDLGLDGLLKEVKEKSLKYKKGDAKDDPKGDFYEACKQSLLGVQENLAAYSTLAKKRANEMSVGQKDERNNLLELSERLNKLRTEPPETVLEGAQLLFTMFTCLHCNGEPIAMGRLDQYLGALYEKDIAAGRSEEEIQDVIDALWIKLDEKVLQNRIFIQDHQPFGNLAMGGASGPYPQGASLGQWIQQITVGGVVADDESEEKPAYNGITKLCLRSAARLPLNAPCLSLRVNKNTKDEYLEEAAKAILSGGAHPILLNDDKIVSGLKQCGDDVGALGKYAFTKDLGDKWRSEVSLKSARDYACDGCYEPMFCGQTWFTLGGFTTLNPLECALNKGRLYASAGPVFLRGQHISERTKGPEDIESFQELLDLYFYHFYILWAKALDGQISTFDALADVCPSPLLSVLTDDCLGRGQDIYAGGARYNVYGPCFIALSSTINSLYNINRMVFRKDTAVTSLPELVECLMCDWGNNMCEPFISSLVGPVRTASRAERYKRLREIALSQDKYGRGAEPPCDVDPVDPGTCGVDQLGDYIIKRMAELTIKVFREPEASTAAKMKSFAEKHGSAEFPFGFQIVPGVGTFENFVAFGGGSGASADGRRLNEAIASDLSPSPSPMDRMPQLQKAPFIKSLKSFTGEGADMIWEGAPTDFNVAEDFPVEDLTKVLREFANGEGANVLTVSVANHDVLQQAVTRPEKFDLVRLRMGGWTEFFTAMFPMSQQQHLRRPFSTPM